MRRFLVCLAAVPMLSCDDDPPPSPGDPAAVGVYSEFLAYGDVQENLPALASRGATLNLAVASTRIGDNGLAELLLAAEGATVPVRLWLVVPEDDGYWPNEANLDLFATELDRLLDWIESRSLAVDGVVFDLEPAYAYTLEIRDRWTTLDRLEEVVDLLRSHMDEAAYQASVEKLTGMVEAVQARGMKAVCVTYPQIVDDVLDGDHDLQDAMDIPVQGIPFDEVGFMVYETGFAEALDTWIGPGLIRSFAADAFEHFGERATIGLGLIGETGLFPPEGAVYTEPADLALDVAAARAEGIARVEIYSLDGMVELGGATRRLDATRAAPRAGAPADIVDLVRSVTGAVDDSLETAPTDAGAPEAGPDADTDGGADAGVDATSDT